MKNLIKQYFLSTHKSVDAIEIFKNDEPHSLWSVFLTQGKAPNEVVFRHDIDSDMIEVIRDWGLDQMLKQKESKKEYYKEYNKKKG
jgi:hypothetical protein